MASVRLSRYSPHSPTPPQIAFLALDELEALYGGAAGGGKSDALLMGALQYVDTPGYAALILRRTYADLALPQAIMARSKVWLAPFKESGEVGWSEQDKTWRFPSGATITFGYLANDNDVYRYQSAEFQFVGFDELTQFTEFQYTYLFSRLRRPSAGPLSTVPLRMRAATNPGGVGHGWVKKRFITKREQGRLFIPAKLADNPHADREEYVKSLANLGTVLRQQLLDGDWGAFEGAAYPGFDERIHVVNAFEVPAAWERFEQMDFGINNPTAWHPVAVDYDGNLVVFDEYYSPGIVSDHARAITALRENWWPAREDGWGRKPTVWADPSVRHRTGGVSQLGDPATIVTEFADNGIGLSAANNDPRAGFARVQELLRVEPGRLAPEWAQPNAALTAGAPRLYIFRTCTHLIDQLRSAPLQPLDKPDGGEKVDPVWESQHGHAHAALRYGVMSRPGPSTKPEPVEEDPRAEHARRWLEQKRNPETVDEFGYQDV